MRMIAIGVLACGALCAQSEDPARVRALVDAGALPRTRLAEVDQEIADARDEDVLRRVLYGMLAIEDLTEQQAADVVEAASRRVARQKERLEHARTLVEAGALPKLSLAPIEEELESRQRTLGIAEARAALIRELAEIARLEKTAWSPHDERFPAPVAERFDGSGVLRPGDVKAVAQAFEKQFAHPLPISARGSTALHRAMGFNHTGRVDVALDPDTPEGVWLRRYLEALRIPYFAFRTALPGRATGPHIHIGPPSERISSGG